MSLAWQSDCISNLKPGASYSGERYRVEGRVRVDLHPLTSAPRMGAVTATTFVAS
jgi:hypothetical protein